MEQNADTGASMTPVVEKRQKNGNGLKITTAIACVVAVCGIGFGVYGMTQISERDEQISILKTQLAEAKLEAQKDITNITDEDGSDSYFIDNSDILDFDFDTLSKDLESSINNNMKPILAKCTLTEKVEEIVPNIRNDYTLLSESTIDSVVKKLKSAESVDKNVTDSWIYSCPPKSVTYYISVDDVDNPEKVLSQRVFSLNYTDADDTLLVGYNDTGYAFHFDQSEDIDNFIESLSSDEKNESESK